MKRLSRLIAVLLTASLIIPCAGGIPLNATGGVRIDEEHFPDPNFRACIAGPDYDKDRDGFLSQNELDTTYNIHCENSNITSVEGIEYFTALQGLWCLNNNISDWDLSGNPNLVGVWCSHNSFTSLDFSANPRIEWVYCYNCDLRSLNVSNNPELGYLECNANPHLTSLDVSRNRKLENLFCSDCGLTSLDLTHNPNLCELDAFSNDLRSVDFSNNTRLKRLDIWNNPNLGNVDISNLTGLQYYNCAANNVTRLDLSSNRELAMLVCSYNSRLTSLNLSNNPKLAYLNLECDYRLTSLDLSHNPRLYYLQAFGLGGISTLNIGNNSRLLKAYYDGVRRDEPQLGNVHSYTVDYGGSGDYFDQLAHCLVVDNGVNIVTRSNGAADVPDSVIDTNDGHSSSERFVTREEAVALLYQMAGSPAVSGSSRFTDVPSDASYAAAVKWGEDNNICFGYPNICSDTFGTGQPVSRQDFALMAHRLAGVLNLGTAFDYGRTDWFDDYYDIDFYAWGAFTWAVQWGVLSPSGDNVYPHGRMTRAELQAGAARIFNLDEGASYSSRVNANGDGGAASLPDAPEVTPAIPTRSPSAPRVSSEPGVGGFVERLYTVALERASDPAGKQDWVEAITMRGETGADAARGFLYSPEFLGRGATNEEFVAVLYRTFFNREPDQAGFNAWVGVLRAGTSKEEVIEGFINSTEWANLCLRYGIRSGGSGTPDIEIEPNQGTIDFATRLYTTCLGRDADQNGLMAWARQLANQRDTGTGAARGFFFSEEFGRQGVSNDEYVRRLYRTFMGREPDAAGFDAWVSQLNSGVSREEVFNGFALSPEFARICASYGIIR